MENWLPPNFISVLFIPAPDLGLGDTYSKRSTNNTLDRVGRAKIGAMTTNIIPPIPVTSMHAHVLYYKPRGLLGCEGGWLPVIQ